MKKEKIITTCKETHIIEYDYSLILSDYRKNDTIPIICPKHGLFRPRLARFLKGSNCPSCNGKVLKTKEKFVSEANLVHHNKYSYNNFVYVNSHTKSFITCPTHGDFKQTPTNHLNGCGCPSCKNEKLSQLFIDTTESFIEKAQKIHSNKYSYDKVQYINSLTKCVITCPVHGDFQQSPHNHIQGKGCPQCHTSHMENEIKTFLIKNSITFEEQKRFPWMGKQSLDFYLPQYNTAIECQGKQHFGEGGWSKKYDFSKQLQYDKTKFILCEQNKIKLLYFIPQQYKDHALLFIYNKDNSFYLINQLEDLLNKK